MQSLNRRRLLAGAGIVGAGLLSTQNTAEAAGPLPDAGTPRGMAEIEPRVPINSANTPGDAQSLFRITSPGSYYLTGNITGVKAAAGIVVSASHVTIDLMGFTLAGVARSLGAIVTSGGPHIAIVIRNGFIHGWEGGGIDLTPPGPGLIGGDQSLIEHVRASSNRGFGLRAGCAAIIRHCVVEANPDDGLIVNDRSLVESCIAALNGGTGVVTGNGCIVRDSSFNGNAGGGLRAGIACVVANCNAYANGGSGIVTSHSARVHECAASSNLEDGIQGAGDSYIALNSCAANGVASGLGAGIRVTGTDNRIENNHVTCNGRGLSVDAPANLIIGNTASGNASNYEFVEYNRFGEVVDATTVVSPAVSGNMSFHPGGGISSSGTRSNVAF